MASTSARGRKVTSRPNYVVESQTDDTSRMGSPRYARKTDAYRPDHTVPDSDETASSGDPEPASDAFDLQAWDDVNTFPPGTQIQRSPSPILASQRTFKAINFSESSPSPEDIDIRQEAHRAYEDLIHDTPLQEKEVATCTVDAVEYVDTYTNCMEKYPEFFVKQERVEQATIADVDTNVLGQHIWLIIMTANTVIHEAVLKGDLATRSINDAEVKQALQEMQQRCEEVPYQPRIYCNSHAHKETGLPMSPRMMSELTLLAAKYVFDDDLASKIDSVTVPHVPLYLTRIGVRKYLSTKDQEGEYRLPSNQRVQRLGVLCRALGRRCEEIPKDRWGSPLPGGFTEFGYSHHVESRLKQHKHHASSNYLMNPFDAICRRYYEDYVWFQFVVYHIPAPILVELSEMYFTRAGQGYCKNGGGCSHSGAGRSNASGDLYDASDYENFWNYARTSVMDNNISAWKEMIDRKIREKREETATRKRRIALEDELAAKKQAFRELLAPLPEEEEVDRTLAFVKQALAETIDEARRMLNEEEGHEQQSN
ncbi:hypothetical protein KC332_g12971 [Hortaea werneckii]|nr:hypothetical protein KC358_g12906 [Hortaea werneckii]KAI6810263.1 hypothetical protein KC350_g12610 [Hortaea werneckii]KAI6911059.1 hypothetical protein KC348_g13039 [Hortaea werneckii]KAI6926496.1 hypothetical protein KC341_g12743 [Hortaea werneckii]KAI6960415.1 hypothetical protein KC321_g12863 [Hortaea werneckii]